ncbi:MAG: class I SAM-dependent methyltransferase [Proteobacteria bacterium]|nr:class I SAM-dependent methyltransferase [Pseudomonadota bacterium]MBU4469431.1 class I SAM-dependent methyltransferase [Pseudomonadota bacterium]MCG2752332.1 class I SAM-dependent methyltransferase [Desulfobacteraceae bacterium]
MDYESQESKIRGFERGYRAVYVINIGLQFGLFRALCADSEGLTAKNLADRLSLYEPYLKIWLLTAYHFELLDCDSRGMFTLQPCLAEILGIDMGLEPIIQNAGSSSLARYILTGVPAPRHRSPEESLATSRATQTVYMVFLSYILEKYDTLKQFMNKGIRFIDIGCGSGNLIIELALAFPNSSFQGIDTDIHGLERAGSTSNTLGIHERVSFEDLSAEELDCHEEFDVACMVATLHEILPADRPLSLKNIHRALKSGGRLILLDFPYPEKLEDFRDQRYGIGIIEQFFEAPGGVVHLCATEQDSLLKQVGFNNIQRSDLNNGMFDLIVAVK